MSHGHSVIIYELNEVPWAVLDYYAGRHPQSNLSRLIRNARCQTTIDPDQELNPWVSWPTFHKGIPAAEHKSVDLGQDPATILGENIWDVAEANGLAIGLFGPLQSWPPHEPRNGGFYIPDTFSRDEQTFPRAFARFQRFNLSMTKQQGFSSNAPLKASELALAGADLVTKGLTPRSAGLIIRQLLRERRDGRYKACRSVYQALPSFDMYWRLHQKRKPDLSIFFTNHVASMMHRYWGDAMPGYAEEHGYPADDVFARFLPLALDVFDHQLGKIMRFVERNRESVLIVAAAMGQQAVDYIPLWDLYVVEDAHRFAAKLGFGPVEPGLAMYPSTTLKFPSEAEAQKAIDPICSVLTHDGMHVFRDVRVAGRTLHISVDSRVAADTSRPLRFCAIGNGSVPQATVPIDQLGLGVNQRLGGANTAHHFPEAPMLTYGAAVDPDRSRGEISLLDAAPTILEWLGCPAERLSAVVHPSGE